MTKSVFPVSLIAALVLAGCVHVRASHAESSREFVKEIPAEGLSLLVLNSGVGEVRVRAAEDDTVKVRVTIKDSDNNWFDSQNDLEAAELVVNTDRERLELDIEGEDLSEDWVLELPARLALELDHGVGEVKIDGLEGDIDVDLGVGDLDIRVGEEQVGDVETDVGVGEVEIEGRGSRSGGGMPFGQKAHFEGQGQQQIRADVGVGDVEIHLE